MYHYETLGDERFQQFCQALITTSFPNAQALPVGQPDGGRDAFVRRFFHFQKTPNNFKDKIVFQVKYVRSASDTRTDRSMIESVIKSEKAKIENLKKIGLSKYYLVTNLKGTSHLNSGSIDKVNELLTKEFGIESYCWWRDDLDRRLDAQSSIKWSYPEILKATDLLEALVKGKIGEDEARRQNAIRAYITTQYGDDEELKFKQTELRSTMTDLFVDLPMQSSEIELEEYFMPSTDGATVSRYAVHPSLIRFDRHQKCAAEHFVLNNNGEKSERVVLEGAPGQGKSTVTQYVCQVMRMHLLGKISDIEKLPHKYKSCMVRIPFRVDLRDLAKWMSGVDPFQSKAVLLDAKESRSLEGFLAGQVRFMSGGHEFNVSDLTAIARASHIFLALDGFDEVADSALRSQLVHEITKGTGRLMNAGGFSVKTVVTSRPAAFAKSVRFPKDQWAYFELLPLERDQVDEYSLKWMSAKGIKKPEQVSLHAILDQKLKEPHTQFLAKNPMQLTILLSLIHTRGSSLPEKRTAMYDAYMDMFFSRESEKSDVVRDNRELLIDIHRYLAWILQTSAESGENGSIERNELRRVLLLYLDDQKENTNIVGELFDGVIERVGALVSRVQETYEFEVQPLREYFAARHLYETAPYSPIGDEKTGTKLDRFNALIRNPYWLNVARFYGGCFSKGEISALVDEICTLASAEPYRVTSHARSIALMLLGDWVFTQYQPAVKRIVSLICERPQLRQLLASFEPTGSSWSSLPERSGRSDLIDYIWKFVVLAGSKDELQALAGIIVRNSELGERLDKWKEIKKDINPENWIYLGIHLRIFSDAELNVAAEPDINDDVICQLIRVDRFDAIGASELEAKSLNLVLNEAPVAFVDFPCKRANRVSIASTILGFYQYRFAFSDDGTLPVRDAMLRRISIDNVDFWSPENANLLEGVLRENERKAFHFYNKFVETSCAITSSSITPWVELVESMRQAWGDCRAIDKIAFTAAGIKSKDCPGVEGALDSSANLIETARYIRLKSGAPKWWSQKLSSTIDQRELYRLLLLLWSWATPRTIILIGEVLSNVLNGLDCSSWSNLCKDYKSMQFLRVHSHSYPDLSVREIESVENLGSRMCMFLGMKVSYSARHDLSLFIARDGDNAGLAEQQFAIDSIVHSATQGGKWSAALPTIRQLYSLGASVNSGWKYDDGQFSQSMAREVAENCEQYPLPLVAIADSKLRSIVGSGAPKLLDVANSEKWFSPTS